MCNTQNVIQFGPVTEISNNQMTYTVINHFIGFNVKTLEDIPVVVGRVCSVVNEQVYLDGEDRKFILQEMTLDLNADFQKLLDSKDHEQTSRCIIALEQFCITQTLLLIPNLGNEHEIIINKNPEAYTFNIEQEDDFDEWVECGTCGEPIYNGELHEMCAQS